MAGKFPSRGEFTVASTLFDEHEWLTDSLIDSYGVTCTIEYPPIDSECTNCYFDPNTGRSTNIYRSGGPHEFPNHTICPVCGGEGRSVLASTEAIKVRFYSNVSDWVKFPGVNFVSSDGVAQIIGYMNDLPKISRARNIIITVGVDDIKQMKYESASEALPWGLRHNRYFVMFIKRIS